MRAKDFTRRQIAWTRQVRQDRRISDKAVRIADALAFDYMNAETGDAWPAMATLCEAVDASERAVRRALDQMVEGGHLSIKSGGGRRQSNRYRWIIRDKNPGKYAGVSDAETPAYAEEFSGPKPRQKRQRNSGTFGMKTLANMPEDTSEVIRHNEPEGGRALGRASANSRVGVVLVEDEEDHHEDTTQRALGPVDPALGAAADTDLASDPISAADTNIAAMKSWADEDDDDETLDALCAARDAVIASHEDFPTVPRLTGAQFAIGWTDEWTASDGGNDDFRKECANGAAAAWREALAQGGKDYAREWWRQHREALTAYVTASGYGEDAAKEAIGRYGRAIGRADADRRAQA
ncbi:hypothetical protein G5B31_15345 [Rhodobacter sp. SGA-6-6]|uniref:hypothetical protein n=1 Tax=Rhodobacter sp. SGA-6-6 TaxID=2710882 RepID=UPI0013EC77A2|nr:hypothetical protein [Rhodobacter sp. SGA-6-6]NGM46911.1 hypothetical protein [Rhodobacter sp. SGA-6-6]